MKILILLLASLTACTVFAEEAEGTVSLDAPTIVWVRTGESEQIPINFTFSTASSDKRTIRWHMTDGTAKLGTDFLDAFGEMDWSGTTETRGSFNVRIAANALISGRKWFSVELTTCDGVSLDATATKTTIWLLDGGDIPYANTTNATSAVARLENRDWSTLAASLANGAAVKAADGESAATDWDTTAEVNGWQTFSDGETNRQVLVQNDAQYEIVGGRLAGDTTWTSNKVYVVRNWVFVPDGCTLTIMTNTVVKFCEQTGISGNVVVKGCEIEPVVWTSAKDDTIGGDTDFKVDTPAWGDYNVASVCDTGLAIRYTTLSSWGTASATPLAVGAVSAGAVRVPVTIETTRTTPFFVNWRTTDGATCGQLRWESYTEGTKFIELPVAAGDADGDGTPSLPSGRIIELYESQGINLDTAARLSEVAVYKDATLQMFNCTAQVAAASARLENRDWTTTGAALVNGVVAKSYNGATAAAAWNTTDVADGWVSVFDGATNRALLVRNAAPYVVVGGRLAGDETWTADKIYLVRNWVYVPTGCTLTIAENTLVKFCEQTGISGNVVVAGNVECPVVLTAVADDARGGDADLRNATPVFGTYSVTSLTHTGCELRYATAADFPVVSVPSLVAGSKGSGMVRVPVSVSGSRTDAFSVNWQATDLTVRYGEDYAVRCGTLVWKDVSEGTKFVEIPLNASGMTEKDEQFVFTLTGGTDMTVASAEGAATVDLYDSDRLNDREYLGVVASVSSPYAAMRPAVFDFAERGNAHEAGLRAWLKEKGALTADLDGKEQPDVAVAVQEAGEKLSVKGLPYWQEYVAGTDPTNEMSVFTARIEMADGVPHISWKPDMNNGEGREGVRTYRLLGKSDLADAKWSEVPEGQEADYRFFKMAVEMP